MDELKLPQDSELAKKVLENSHESSKHSRELGILGRFFGSSDTGKVNIAGLFIFLLVFSGIIFTFLLIDETPEKRGITILELWGILTPLITLALGYIFGKSDN